MATRPKWPELFMKIALEVAKMSTCASLKVGAIIVKNNRIVSMGYNGVPKGQKHCNEIFKKEELVTPEMKEKHLKFQLANEIHAEMNAILFAAKNGISTDGSSIYTTWSPCTDCAKAILQAGIKEVYYLNEYRMKDGIYFLRNNQIICKQLENFKL